MVSFFVHLSCLKYLQTIGVTGICKHIIPGIHLTAEAREDWIRQQVGLNCIFCGTL